MLSVRKSRVEEVCFHDYAKLEYFNQADENKWKIPMIKEIVDIKHGDLKVLGIDSDELNNMLDYLCTS